VSGNIPPQFQVDIPQDRVALYPSNKRDESKLLIVDRSIGTVTPLDNFAQIIKFISNDLIVLNETKVLPARVFGKRLTGGVIEFLFLVKTARLLSSSPDQSTTTEYNVSTLLSTSRRPQPGLVISLPDEARFEVIGRSEEGGWEGIWSSEKWNNFESWLNTVGVPPLPPYIKRSVEPADYERYQTVYAQNTGSVAAPTAGLHFTPELLSRLEQGGADIARLTLDVGWGTFEPIKTEDLTQHVMHRESFFIPEGTADSINNARISGRSVLAVGTTSIRALEAAAIKGLPLKAGHGEASIFIYPPYQFQIVDKVLTNFHRPDSTLLQLIAALTGWELLNEAYQCALDNDFHFFSYGDAMLII